MNIQIKKVENKKDLRTYIYLPEEIHKNHKNWLHPIYSDEWTFYSPKNKIYSYADTVLYLAYNQEKVVGRVMGIINKKYNEASNINQARFCFLDTYEDKKISDALLNEVENWAKQKGMQEIIGPFGFSDKEPQGLLIEGFEEPSVIVTNHSFEYLKTFVESRNYQPKLDLVQYLVSVPNEMPEIYKRASERAENKGFIIKEFTRRSEIKPYVRPVFHLINETYTQIFGFAAFDEKEMDEFANRYIYLLDPRLIKMILNPENEPLAFVISMPDISEGIRRAKGKLLPFGIFKILASRKKTKQLNLLLGAIKPEFRNQGLDALLAVKLLESAKELGLEKIDSHLIMEENKPMRAEMERLNAKIYKRYRVYQKKL